MIIFNIITACTRPQNLESIKESIEKALENMYGKKKFSPFIELVWHICYDRTYLGLDFTPTLESQKIIYRKGTIPFQYEIKTYFNDVDKSNEGNRGSCPKNIVLETFNHGFVCFLDDDNVMMENYLSIMEDNIHIFTKIIICSERRHDGTILLALPQNMKVGSVDTAQILFRRECLGTIRLDLDAEEDGRFIQKLVGLYYNETRFLPEHIIVGYNQIKSPN